MKHLFQLKKFPPAVQLLVLMMLFFLGSMLQALSIPLMGITDIKAGNSMQTLSLMVSTQLFLFLLPALAFIGLLPASLRHFAGFRKVTPATDLLRLVALSACTIFLVSGIAQLIMQLPLGTLADQMQRERNALEDAALEMGNWQQLSIRILVMALLPALCEELFFRAVLQRFLFTFIKKPLLAIAATSIIFALFHGSIYNLLPIALAGMVLGLVYHYSGNIWYSIILHFLVNGTQVVFSYFQQSDTSEEDTGIVYALLFSLVGIIAVLAILRSIKRGKQVPATEWTLPYEPMFK